MASIFRKDDNFVDKPNRNSFDLSYQNNLTTKFGVLKPVYLSEVIPGDSFKIRPDFALRFLPMQFPVQTRMRAHLHFFYVRNRTIWKEWMDFIGKTKDNITSPYLNITESNKKMFEVGGIADSFGVPVVLNSNNRLPLSVERRGHSQYYFDPVTGKEMEGTYTLVNWTQAAEENNFENVVSTTLDLSENNASYVRFGNYEYNLKAGSDFEYKISSQAGTFSGFFLFKVEYSSGNTYYATRPASGVSGTNYSIVFEGGNFDDVQSITNITPLAYFDNDPAQEFVLTYYIIPSEQPQGIKLSELTATQINEYFGANSEPLNVLPFRAYEAIYNSFYRNAENNPYILNGVPEYNKYIPTYESGADSNLYDLRNRNWEDDFLTTAVQSPQQGNAPLVGLVNQNNTNPAVIVTFANDDGTKTRVRFHADPNLTNPGNSRLIRLQSAEEFQNSTNSPTVPSDGYVGQLEEAMMEAVKFGININDFRNVNSFQRWLENNVRKGYKYKDQIKGHYGVSVRYDELDMPEFIGGISRDVSVQQVTQTVENEYGKLGEYGGQSYVMGSGETINHYCDEHGFIIGILSVVPMANYSQMIPKLFLKRDALDYYFPEFGKIGMQPILNKEVTFLESISADKKDEIFGYQRAWYDYIARTDEVHGLFRTQFKQFLIGRTFNSLPDLNSSFSTIDNNQLNSIFYVDDDEDKILGQIYFDVTAIRPIPIYGIPSLE